MKEGRTLQELAVELQRQRNSMRDFKAPTSKLSMYDDGQFAMDTGGATPTSFETNNLFLGQLASWADIPKKYFDRLATEARPLLAENVNHWLNAKNETRLIRTVDNTVRAFLSHRYRMIDNIDVVETVLPVFAEHEVATVSTDVTPGHLYIKAVDQRRTVEIKKGDAVQIGVCISNSEVGLGAVHVDPLVFRLVCLNGAIVADAGLRKFHIGKQLREFDDAVEVFKDDTVVADNKAFFLKLRDVVNAAFDQAQMTDLLQSIEAGTKRRLGDDWQQLETVVELTGKKHGMSEAESQSVLKHLIQGNDLTQWGLANAVTETSKHTITYERATELETIGGSIMTLDEENWKELVN